MFVRLDSTKFSALSIRTGDNLTISGNITGLSNDKTQGHLKYTLILVQMVITLIVETHEQEKVAAAA